MASSDAAGMIVNDVCVARCRLDVVVALLEREHGADGSLRCRRPDLDQRVRVARSRIAVRFPAVHGVVASLECELGVDGRLRCRQNDHD